MTHTHTRHDAHETHTSTTPLYNSSTFVHDLLMINGINLYHGYSGVINRDKFVHDLAVYRRTGELRVRVSWRTAPRRTAWCWHDCVTACPRVRVCHGNCVLARLRVCVSSNCVSSNHCVVLARHRTTAWCWHDCVSSNCETQVSPPVQSLVVH